MKIQGFIYFIFLTCNLLPGQIDFEYNLTDKNLAKRFQAADSAIRAGEFGNIHSLVVIKNGRLIHESYYQGWTKDSVHQLQSATKSVISLLLGCAIHQKLILSEEEPIWHYYTAYKPIDPNKLSIRISDLLTQRHGLKWKENPWNDPDNNWRNMTGTRGDWYKIILTTPMDTLPGKVFNYSNAAPVLVSGILQQASGLPIDTFAKRYLFHKLNITHYWFWHGNGSASNNGMALISLNSRDMAKLGQLVLQNGVWNNERLVDENYLIKSTSSLVKQVEPNGVYEYYDYGYFWWSQPKPRNAEVSDVILARGAGGQHIIIDKKNQVVVVITAWNMQQPNKPQFIYERYLKF